MITFTNNKYVEYEMGITMKSAPWNDRVDAVSLRKICVETANSDTLAIEWKNAVR